VFSCSLPTSRAFARPRESHGDAFAKASSTSPFCIKEKGGGRVES